MKILSWEEIKKDVFQSSQHLKIGRLKKILPRKLKKAKVVNICFILILSNVTSGEECRLRSKVIYYEGKVFASDYLDVDKSVL